jgi:glutathione-regulated potassium-efflux system ancillary protein KefF
MTLGIVVILAHPYLARSRANRALVREIKELPGVDVRNLYELYPDFDIDVAAEQEALTAADVVVWQHPMYWYSVPGLLKHWFDKVLARGWAYGDNGTALHGKRCLWVVTTGGDDAAFRPEGIHGFPMSSFTPHVEQTARFCGMDWLEPVILHGSHRVSAHDLHEFANAYRVRIQRLSEESTDG